MEIEGSVESGYEDVVDVYARLAAGIPDHASSLTVRRRGRKVVDLRVGGYPAAGRQLLFSVSKLVVAIGLHRAADLGAVDLDAPLSRSWAAFRRADLSSITLRDVLSHRSGLFRLEMPIAVADLLGGGDRVAVVAQARDTRFAHAYHAFTFGTLVTGALEAAGAPSPSALIEELLVRPLGLDLTLGDDGRGAPLPVRFTPPAEIEDHVSGSGVAPVDEALVALLGDPEIFNTVQFRRAESAAMGVVGTSDALSHLMAVTIAPEDQGGILSPHALAALRKPRSAGRDGALGVTTSFGSGVQLPFPRAPWTSRFAFGHEGAGGCAAFGDPSLGIAVGFTTDQFPRSPGASPVLAGLFSCLRQQCERAG